MNVEVDVQIASKSANLPTPEDLKFWVTTALSIASKDNLELTVRIVDEVEMRALNRDYRKQDRPTNVLSFPFDDPPGVKTSLLGDILICAPVVEGEAREFGLKLNERWAHMVVHGVLHLCGYDHLHENDAYVMTNLELQILEKLEFDNRELSASVLSEH